jgi:hypothetical protein
MIRTWNVRIPGYEGACCMTWYNRTWDSKCNWHLLSCRVLIKTNRQLVNGHVNKRKDWPFSKHLQWKWSTEGKQPLPNEDTLHKQATRQIRTQLLGQNGKVQRKEQRY